MSEQPPTVYQYSVKLEMGAKGDIKPTVHVYAMSLLGAQTEAITLLKQTIEQLKRDKFNVAPLETKV